MLTGRALLALACLVKATWAQSDAAAALVGPGAAARREFRAAWIATVSNIDWPSRPGLPTPQQRDELRAIVDRAAELHLNALVFQVRPMCDALYASELEPWSEWLTGERGRAPRPPWDPLAFAVEQAHDRGLELHAWFNPFRVRHAKARPLSLAAAQRDLPGTVVRYGDQLWLDPGDPAAQSHALAVIGDVVQRYDIDGVHLDDYFYPYPERGEDFPDRASYASYRGESGALSRADWRRANVDRFVASVYAAVKRSKPWVKVGLSPFGIARPGVPAGIVAGLDQFAQLHADPRRWLEQGWCDYLAPQLYWPIEPPSQSYRVLLSWWAGQNPRGRHLWPGSYTSKVAFADDPWPAAEIVEQVHWSRRVPGVSGQLHFSMRALMAGSRVAQALRAGPYAEPALVPVSPWLDATPPAPPRVRSRREGDQVFLTVEAEPEVRVLALYARAGREWRLLRALPAALRDQRLRLEPSIEALAVAALDRCGNASEPAAVAIR